MSVRRVVVAASLGVSLSSFRAAAQCGPSNLKPVRGALIGVVTDSLNRPIGGVDIFITKSPRAATTDENGVFRITRLDRGEYEVTARRLEYTISVVRLSVGDSGGTAHICLARVPVALPAVITSASRGALTGIVVDMLRQPIAAAEVRLMGENTYAKTDSAGAFFMPLKKGRHALVVSRKGYERRIVGLTAPDDSGRNVELVLVATRAGSNRLAMAMWGMRERVLTTPANRYALVTAEDLDKSSMNIVQAVRMAGRTTVSDTCEVFVDGGYKLPLGVLDKQDIEMMEVLTPGPRRDFQQSMMPAGTAPTSINGMKPIKTQSMVGYGVPADRPSPGANCPTMFAWLKR